MNYSVSLPLDLSASLPLDLIVRVCPRTENQGTSRRKENGRLVKGCGKRRFIQGETARPLSSQDAPQGLETEKEEVKK